MPASIEVATLPEPAGVLKFILQITIGIVRDQNMRRNVMFFVVLAAIVMLFLGATFLNSFLTARPFYFLGYWGLCAWLTVLAMLMAIYDLLVVRARARLLERELRAKILGDRDDRP